MGLGERLFGWSVFACLASDTVTEVMKGVLKDQGYVFNFKTKKRFRSVCNTFNVFSPVKFRVKIADVTMPGFSHAVSTISIKPVNRWTEEYIKRFIKGFVDGCLEKPWKFEKGSIKGSMDYLKRRKNLKYTIPAIVIIASLIASILMGQWGPGIVGQLISTVIGLLFLFLIFPLIMRSSKGKKAWERWVGKLPNSDKLG